MNDPDRRTGRHKAGLFVGALVVGALFVPGVVDDLLGATRWGVGATWLGDTDRPTPQAAPHAAPLRPPLPPPDQPGTFAFMATQPGSDQPVTYDPCRPVSIVINDLRAPPRSQELIRSSLARMTEITGFEFVVEGTSNEIPTMPRPAHQPDRYGDRWAPVLIIWATEEDIPDLAGYGGLGGSSIARAPGTDTHMYVSGVVALNGPEISRALTHSRGWFLAEALVLHELGHLLGLDHVDTPTELMYHDATGRYDFGPGDLAGLAELASGPCVPEL